MATRDEKERIGNIENKFSNFIGMWEEYRKFDDSFKIEVKDIITSGHDDLHKKIDSLHESQQREIDEIKSIIKEPINGLIARQDKTDTYIKNAKTGLMWLAGLIGTEIIALIGYFKEKIIAFFH